MSSDHHFRFSVTARQKAILDLIAKGHTNGEIAERVGLSLAGVKYQVSELLSLAGVDSRAELGDAWSAGQVGSARFSRFRLRGLGLAGLVAAGGTALGAAALVVWGVFGSDTAEPRTIAARLNESLAEQAAREVLQREIGQSGLDAEFETSAGPLSEASFDLASVQFERQVEAITRPGLAPPVSLGGRVVDGWNLLFEAAAGSFDGPVELHALVLIDDSTGEPLIVEIFGPLAGYDGALGRLSPVYRAGEIAAAGPRTIVVEAWKSPGSWCFQFADPAHPELNPGDLLSCPLTFAQARDDQPIYVFEEAWFGDEILYVAVGGAVASLTVTLEAAEPVVVAVNPSTGSGFPRTITGIPARGVLRVEAFDAAGFPLAEYVPSGAAPR